MKNKQLEFKKLKFLLLILLLVRKRQAVLASMKYFKRVSLCILQAKSLRLWMFFLLSSEKEKTIEKASLPKRLAARLC